MKRTFAAARSRAGVTLIELLVVCTIIAILSAMAFPALTGAVARGRLTACTNNLNQLGYAALRFDQQYSAMPGWFHETPATPPTLTTGSAGLWAAALLPFLDRNDVYEEIGLSGTIPNVNIDSFICPSISVKKTGTASVLHYAANVGATGTVAADGVFLNKFVVEQLSLERISSWDGTASTLAFTEKSGVGMSQSHRWTYSKPVTQAGSLGLFGPDGPSDLPSVFGIQPGITPSSVQGTHPNGVINTTAHIFAPSSAHAGGVAVAFCDGHTAFLNDTMNYFVYAQLVTPRTRWKNMNGTWNNLTNSSAMYSWLLKPAPDNSPYTFDAKDLR